MSAFETIKADNFIDGLIDELWYADKDYHNLISAKSLRFYRSSNY